MSFVKIRPSKEELFDPPWTGGYNVYLDVSGEYMRGSGWTFDKRFLGPCCNVLLRILISEGRRRRKPSRWRASVVVNGRSLRLPEYIGDAISTTGRCGSLRDACRQADRIPEDDLLREASRQMWDKGRVRCVFKMDGEKAIPFLTQSFCAFMSDVSQAAKTGDTLVVAPCRNIRESGPSTYMAVNVVMGGYCGTTVREGPEPWV